MIGLYFHPAVKPAGSCGMVFPGGVTDRCLGPHFSGLLSLRMESVMWSINVINQDICNAVSRCSMSPALRLFRGLFC